MFIGSFFFFFFSLSCHDMIKTTCIVLACSLWLWQIRWTVPFFMIWNPSIDLMLLEELPRRISVPKLFRSNTFVFLVGFAMEFGFSFVHLFTSLHSTFLSKWFQIVQVDCPHVHTGTNNPPHDVVYKVPGNRANFGYSGGRFSPSTHYELGLLDPYHHMSQSLLVVTNRKSRYRSKHQSTSS